MGYRFEELAKMSSFDSMESKENLKHLWDISGGFVEEDQYTWKFDTWDKSQNEKFWNSNYIFGNLPVFWVWLNPDSGDGPEFFEDVPNPCNILILVYLQLAPLRASSIFINVDIEREEEIRKWLIKHGFLELH